MLISYLCRNIPTVILSISILSCAIGEVKKAADVLDLRITYAKGEGKVEMDSHTYEKSINSFWDKLREENHDFSVLKEFPFNKIELPAFGTAIKNPGRTFKSTHNRVGKNPNFISFDNAVGALERFGEQGFVIDYTNWHLVDYSMDDDGIVTTEVEFEIHASGPEHTLYRRIIEGSLNIVWLSEKNEDELFMPDTISFNKLEMIKRSGVQAFNSEVLIESQKRETGYRSVILEDLDLDGDSDIVFPNSNKVFINEGDFEFSNKPFLKHRLEKYVATSIFVDIDMDGIREYLQIANGDGIYVYYKNKGSGLYDGKPKRLFKGKKTFGAEAISVGDLNGDNLPDLFLGRYRLSHLNGYFPNPYFDSNNGYSSSVLINNGKKGFEDITSKSFIKEKRYRNVTSSSIVDLNYDGQNDLLVISDFGGVDLYLSQKNGELVLSDANIDGPRMFGCSHVIDDFDGDGNVDIFVTGRLSHVVKRLQNIDIALSGADVENEMRSVVNSGNKILYGDGTGKFAQLPKGAGVVDSGWSYGSASLDYNNNGFQDLMISNGNVSKKFASSYDSDFWNYDIYSAKIDDPKILKPVFDFFGPKLKVYNKELGWSPYQSNRLFFNNSGQGFVDVGYFSGISDSNDGRTVVAEDFDQDGKMDLLVVSFDQLARTQTVTLYENKVSSRNNWIGLQLRESGGKSIYGTNVLLESDQGKFERIFAPNSGFSSIDSAQMHFGIAKEKSVKKITITWPDGEIQSLEGLEINRYHLIRR